MARLRDIFGTDAGAETEGTWIDYGVIKVKIARAGGANARFDRIHAAKWAPHLRQYELGMLDKKAETRMIAEVYADAIVLDWKDVDGDDGKPLPCTRENVVAMFVAYPDFLEKVITEARRLANFKAVAQETASGN